METVKVLSLRNKAPNIVPHEEYVTERGFPRRSGEISLTREPVWRSQLMNCPGFSPNHVSRRAFGEKTSQRVLPISLDGKQREVFRQRVTASRISIVALNFPQAIAMNLLHGDHTAVSIGEENFVAAMLGSHESGNPWAILTSGMACRSYSTHTFDLRGDSGRAEW